MYVRGIKCYQFCQKFRGKYEILVENENRTLFVFQLNFSSTFNYIYRLN